MLKNKEKEQIIIKSNLMDLLIRNTPINVPKADDLIEGTVIEQRKSILYVNLRPFGTGIIYGKEFNNAKDIIKVLKPGDVITAKVMELQNEQGYVSLSLKEAKQDIVWVEIEEDQKKGTVLNLPISDANKGGLILEYKGTQGFLPASQLKIGHYPRIEDGDKDKILDELKKLIGEKISVIIISINPKEKKLIFSEKESSSKEIKDMLSKYKIGDILECEVTGIVDFGIFVKIDEGLEGLVHISELDWSLVENPGDLFKIGQKIKTQIINIKDNKISLSIKSLKPDPWTTVSEKYKKVDIVKGVVIKFNKYGALVSIEEGVAGLVHISEFKTEDEMRKKLELGKSYPFQIAIFEPKEHKLTLNYLGEEKNS